MNKALTEVPSQSSLSHFRANSGIVIDHGSSMNKMREDSEQDEEALAAKGQLSRIQHDKSDMKVEHISSISHRFNVDDGKEQSDEESF